MDKKRPEAAQCEEASER